MGEGRGYRRDSVQCQGEYVLLSSWVFCCVPSCCSCNRLHRWFLCVVFYEPQKWLFLLFFFRSRMNLLSRPRRLFVSDISWNYFSVTRNLYCWLVRQEQENQPLLITISSECPQLSEYMNLVVELSFLFRSHWQDVWGVFASNDTIYVVSFNGPCLHITCYLLD